MGRPPAPEIGRHMDPGIMNVAQPPQPAEDGATFRTDRLRALAGLNQIIASSLDTDPVLGQIAAVAVEFAGAAVASFWVLNERGATLELRATSAGSVERDAPFKTVRIDQGVVGWVAAQRRPLEIPDVLFDDRCIARDWWTARRLRSFFGVPVLLEGSLLAVLALAGRAPFRLEPDDRAFLETLVAQAALAIRKSRLLAESEARRRAAEALAEMGRTITGALDPDVVAHRIAHGLRVLLGAQAAVLFQVQQATGNQVALAVSGDVGPALGTRPVIPQGMGVVGLAVAERRPVFAPDMLADPRVTLSPDLRDGLAQAPFRAMLAVPLLARDEVMGALAVGDLPGRVFDDEEVRLAQAFADQASLALQHVRLFRQEQERRQQVEAVRAVGGEILRELDLPTLLGLIIRRAVELTGAGAGAVFLWDEAGQHLRPRAWHGYDDWVKDFAVPLGHGLTGIVAQRREALLVNNYRDWPHANPILLDRTPITASLGEPLVYRDRLLGVITVDDRGSGRPFTPQHREILALFAAQAAVAIENARLYQEARRPAQEARLISSTLNADEIFHILLNRTCQILDVSRCAIWEARQEGDRLHCRLLRSVGLTIEGQSPVTLRVGEGTTGGCIARRTPVWTADILADPELSLSPETQGWVEAEGYRAVCSAPILLPDGPFGALVIYRDEPHAFDPREVSLLSAFADQAAIAIQNAQLYQQEQARRRQLEAVREVTAEIARELDLTTLLRLLHQRAAALVGAAAGAVWLWDEAEDALIPQSWSGHGDVVSRLRLRLGEGLAGAVAQRREGLVVNDYRISPYAHPLLLEQTRVSAALAEPLLYHNRLVGVITVGTSAPERSFTEQDREILNLFAGHAAIAIENARLYQREQQRHRQVAAVREVTADLLRELDLSTLLGLIQRRAAELVGATAGVVYLWSDEAQLLIPQAWFGFGEWMRATRLRLGQGITGIVAERREGLIVNDYRTWWQAISAFLKGSEAAACVAEPLLYRDRLVGVITLTRNEAGGPFTEQDRETFSLFAAQGAIAIENARLYQAERDRASDLAALIPAGRAIASSLDLPQILESIVASAAELTGAPLANLRLSTPEGQLVWQACAGRLRRELEEATRAIPMQVGESFSGEVAATRKSLWVPDVAVDRRETYPDFNARHQLRCYLGVPILIGDRLLGVLSVLGLRRSGVNEGRRELLEMLAGQAALAIEHARLFRQEQERRRQVEAVREVSAEISQELDLSALLSLIYRRAAELVGAASGAVFLWDADTQTLVPRAWVGLGDYMKDVRLRLGESLTGMVAQRLGGMIVNDYRAWPHASPIWLERTEITAALAEPLLYRNRLLGVLTINNLGTGKRFTEQDREILALFAAQAAIAIRNAQLVQESRRHQGRLEALLDVSRHLSQILPVEALLGRIAEACGRLLDCESVGFRLLEGDELVVSATWGDAREIMRTPRLQVGESLSGLVAATGEPLVVSDPADDPRLIPAHRDPLVRLGFRVYLGLPVKAGDRLVGVFGVHTRRPEGFSAEDIAIATAFASQAATALENARLYGEAERRRREAEVLAELARDIAASLDIEKVLLRVAEGAKDLCESEMAGVALRERNGEALIFRHLVGVRLPGAWGFRVEPGKGMTGLAAATGLPRRSNRYEEDNRISNDSAPFAHAEEIVTAMVVPIRSEDRVDGLLCVANRSPRPFTDRDEAILQRLADHAAIALGNVQLFAREETSRATAEASEERFRALVQDLDAIVWEADAAPFRYTFVSQRAEAMLGYPVARWLDEPYFAATLIHPEDRERAVTLCRAAAVEGKDYHQEFRAVAADGRFLWLREVVRVIRDAEDRPQRLRGVTLDITARRQAEATLREREDQLRQAQKMEAVGRLAGGVAHDFNNLMTAIMMYGDLLANNLLEDHSLRHPVDQIRKVADRAAALVRQLLAFSRRQVLQPKLVDLNAVLGDLDQMLRRLLGDTVTLVTVPDPQLYRMKADPGQIEQVIVNLAVNARDAMPQGGRLIIQTANVELDEAAAQRLGGTPPGPLVLLAVTDTGVGMDAETQARMFEPFFTTKEAGKGTGLGLSTVYGIVQQHQGAIAVESAPGQGTTVRIYLPRAMEPAGDAEARSAIPASPRGAETILLVEDETAVRESLRDALRDHGYSVLEAASAADALRLSAVHPGRIDVLLTDVVMPQMSGSRLARRLVRERPEVKVLYMSAHSDEGLEVRDTREGGAGFIQKPFTQDGLARKVREILDGPDTPR